MTDTAHLNQTSSFGQLILCLLMLYGVGKPGPERGKINRNELCIVRGLLL